MRQPTLATFVGITTQLAEHHASQINYKRNELTNEIQRLNDNMRELEERTNHFIRYGWADLRAWYSMPIHPYYGSYGHRHWAWSQYFRALARDLQRPLLIVRRYDSMNVTLTIPRRQYLLPLSAPLFLLPRQHLHNTQNYVWILTNEEFELWRQKLETDEDMRDAAHSTRDTRRNRKDTPKRAQRPQRQTQRRPLEEGADRVSCSVYDTA